MARRQARRTLSAAGRVRRNGNAVPNVTPDPETGIGTWRDRNLIFRFPTSLLPPICNRIAGTKKSGAGSPWD